MLRGSGHPIGDRDLTRSHGWRHNSSLMADRSFPCTHCGAECPCSESLVQRYVGRNVTPVVHLVSAAIRCRDAPRPAPHGTARAKLRHCHAFAPIMYDCLRQIVSTPLFGDAAIKRRREQREARKPEEGHQQRLAGGTLTAQSPYVGGQAAGSVGGLPPSSPPRNTIRLSIARHAPGNGRTGLPPAGPEGAAARCSPSDRRP